MSIGKTIKERRIELGYSQTELAQKCKVTPPCVCQWEKDKRKPDALSLVNLSVALHTSTDSLLGRPINDYSELLADPTAHEILIGFDKLADDQKDALYYFADFLKKRMPRGVF